MVCLYCALWRCNSARRLHARRTCANAPFFRSRRAHVDAPPACAVERFSVSQTGVALDRCGSLECASALVCVCVARLCVWQCDCLLAACARVQRSVAARRCERRLCKQLTLDAVPLLRRTSSNPEVAAVEAVPSDDDAQCSTTARVVPAAAVASRKATWVVAEDRVSAAVRVRGSTRRLTAPAAERPQDSLRGVCRPNCAHRNRNDDACHVQSRERGAGSAGV